jgi:hypothetical protein
MIAKYYVNTAGESLGVFFGAEPPPGAIAVSSAPEGARKIWDFNSEKWVRGPATMADYIGALESHYDATAQSRRYDSRLTCALRAGYPGPFQAEGLAFAIWMDECNAYAYGQMALVQGGGRAQPTPEGLVAELPPIAWP